MTIESFKHGFIFIKTKKTAGTSMELHLGRFCGSTDIVTPMFPANTDKSAWPEIVRAHASDEHGARNFGSEDNPDRFWNHMPALNVAREIGSERYLGMFSFCFERHPVEKCLSYFSMWNYYRVDAPAGAFARLAPPFNDFPTRWEQYLEQGPFPHDHQRYCGQDGTLLVDAIYPYEKLHEATNHVHERLGLPPAELKDRALSGMRSGAKAKGVPIPSFKEVQNNPAHYNRIMDLFAPSLRFANYS